MFWIVNGHRRRRRRIGRPIVRLPAITHSISPRRQAPRRRAGRKSNWTPGRRSRPASWRRPANVAPTSGRAGSAGSAGQLAALEPNLWAARRATGAWARLGPALGRRRRTGTRAAEPASSSRSKGRGGGGLVGPPQWPARRRLTSRFGRRQAGRPVAGMRRPSRRPLSHTQFVRARARWRKWQQDGAPVKNELMGY